MTPTRLPRRPRFPTPRLALLAGVAAIGLAGCGTPHTPVNQQPSPTAYPYPNPNQQAPRDYRRRDSETLYEVPVSSVRAVVGPPQQRQHVPVRFGRDDVAGHAHDEQVAETLLLHLRHALAGEPDLLSFAAITDEPPPEVAAAGHDRCIIPLPESALDRPERLPLR